MTNSLLDRPILHPSLLAAVRSNATSPTTSSVSYVLQSASNSQADCVQVRRYQPRQAI